MCRKPANTMQPVHAACSRHASAQHPTQRSLLSLPNNTDNDPLTVCIAPHRRRQHMEGLQGLTGRTDGEQEGSASIHMITMQAR